MATTFKTAIFKKIINNANLEKKSRPSHMLMIRVHDNFTFLKIGNSSALNMQLPDNPVVPLDYRK